MGVVLKNYFDSILMKFFWFFEINEHSIEKGYLTSNRIGKIDKIIRLL